MTPAPAAQPRFGPVASPPGTNRPVVPTVLMGLGLGGFLNGIMLHHFPQWHAALSCVYTPDMLGNVQINTMADGLFHAATFAFLAAGLWSLWRHARRAGLRMPGHTMAGSRLTGFRAFNLVEGVINHHLFGPHHGIQTEMIERWIWWDHRFLAWGATMLAGRLVLPRLEHPRAEQGHAA